ncbi:hypothetical protein [Bradyrhizobium prioriisuperbiae]|uniref:hypothetical protein n=1 Tax=Bradyrhizobium prioriisuperbiae TaxID=2854389 RepID=UPI0028ECFA67|nr:hypothetical protein [Bradyrhizobium prioritasuperba]
MMIKTTLLFFGLLGTGLSVTHHYEAFRARDLHSIQKQETANPIKTACRLKASHDSSRLQNIEQLASR